MRDSNYFAGREQSALQAAERATSPAARRIHLTLAAAYRQRCSGVEAPDSAQGRGLGDV